MVNLAGAKCMLEKPRFNRSLIEKSITSPFYLYGQNGSIIVQSSFVCVVFPLFPLHKFGLQGFMGRDKDVVGECIR